MDYQNVFSCCIFLPKNSKNFVLHHNFLHGILIISLLIFTCPSLCLSDDIPVNSIVELQANIDTAISSGGTKVLDINDSGTLSNLNITDAGGHNTNLSINVNNNQRLVLWNDVNECVYVDQVNASFYSLGGLISITGTNASATDFGAVIRVDSGSLTLGPGVGISGTYTLSSGGVAYAVQIADGIPLTLAGATVLLSSTGDSVTAIGVGKAPSLTIAEFSGSMHVTATGTTSATAYGFSASSTQGSTAALTLANGLDGAVTATAISSGTGNVTAYGLSVNDSQNTGSLTVAGNITGSVTAAAGALDADGKLTIAAGVADAYGMKADGSISLANMGSGSSISATAMGTGVIEADALDAGTISLTGMAAGSSLSASAVGTESVQVSALKAIGGITSSADLYGAVTATATIKDQVATIDSSGGTLDFAPSTYGYSTTSLSIEGSFAQQVNANATMGNALVTANMGGASDHAAYINSVVTTRGIYGGVQIDSGNFSGSVTAIAQNGILTVQASGASEIDAYSASNASGISSVPGLEFTGGSAGGKMSTVINVISTTRNAMVSGQNNNWSGITSVNVNSMAIGLEADTVFSVTNGFLSPITVVSMAGSAMAETANANSEAQSVAFALGLTSDANIVISGGLAGPIGVTATSGSASAATTASGSAQATSEALAYGIYGFRDINISGAITAPITASASSGRALAVNDNASGSATSAAISVAYGMTGSDIIVTGGISSTIAATAVAETTSSANPSSSRTTAIGINAVGEFDGGAHVLPVVITGTIAASSNGINGLAIAIAAGGGMNLSVAGGTLEGLDNTGNGYAIRSGYANQYGQWTSGSADNTVTLDGATIIGKIDLGSGGNNSLTLLGTPGTGTNIPQMSGVTVLAVGDGSTPTNWTLTPTAGSTFEAIEIDKATLAVNGYVGFSNMDLMNATFKTTTDFSSNGDIAIGGLSTFDVATGTTTTLSGAIADAAQLVDDTEETIPGTLIKTGEGTLVLSGDNSYTQGTTVLGGTVSISADKNLGAPSGTLTLNNGTLLVAQNVTLASTRNVVLGSGGGTFDTNGKTLEIDGAITDAAPGSPGALTKTGAGTLTLTNTGNTYSGITSIKEGILQAGAANVFSPYSVVVLADTAGATLDLNNFDQTIAGLSGGGSNGGNVSLGSATLTVNQDINTTHAGVISGSGALEKSGSGTLALAGTNTYQGGTILTGGMLAISRDANLGDTDPTDLAAGKGTVTFDGGTLQTTGNWTTARTVEAASTGTLDNLGNADTLSGKLLGAGDLTFAGTGTDTLASTFDGSGYTGTLTLRAGTLSLVSGETLGGTLTVASGATLNGVGTVGDLNNSGTVSPGNSPGTITVTGNAIQTATGIYVCQVTPTANDLIAVTGRASLAGTINIQPEYTYYNSGTTWTVLTAGGGVSGTYTTVRYGATPENWVFVPVYMPNSVVLTLERASYSSSATSSQSAATGSGLDAVAYNATGQMATLIQYLDYSYGFDSTQAAYSVAHNALTNYVLNALSPEFYDSFTQILFDGGRLLTAAQRSGLAGGTGDGCGAFASPTDIGPDNLAAMSGPDTVPLGTQEGCSPAVGNHLGIFLKPLGMLAGQQGSSDRTGYYTRTSGITGGVVYSPSPTWTFALAPGFVSQAVTLHTEGGGKGMIQDWSLALLGGYHTEGWHADAGLRAGYDAYQATRNLPLPTFSGETKATWNGWNTSASVGGGYDFKSGKFCMGPFVLVQWQHLHGDGFRESRAGTLGQSLRSRNIDALNTLVGGRVARSFETSSGMVVTPEVRAAWGAQWLSDPGYIRSSFIGVSGSAYHAVTADQRYHSMLLDAGVTLRVKDSLSVSARAGVELFRPGHEAQAASVGINYSF